MRADYSRCTGSPSAARDHPQEDGLFSHQRMRLNGVFVAGDHSATEKHGCNKPHRAHMKAVVGTFALLSANEAAAFLLPRPGLSSTFVSTARPERSGRCRVEGSMGPQEGAEGGTEDDCADAIPKPALSFKTKRMKRSLGASRGASPLKSDPAAAPVAASPKTDSSAPELLKVSKRWACISGCGACCYLAPEERPFLMDYFDESDDLAHYMSMVGDDGWCIHFDKERRMCSIFDDRPWFCRVEHGVFESMYGTTKEEMDRFCTSCCREQIGDVYGVGSPEIMRFNTVIRELKAKDLSTLESTSAAVADWVE